MPVHAKENTDVRLGYKVDKNTFLVKAYSTFGVRTVAANTSHIIQTTVAGMLFYRVPEKFYEKEDVPEGSFCMKTNSSTTCLCYNLIRPTAFLREHGI
ncbi:hypothetical protein CEXT_649801 [Caerostris extrusa]|uniref:Uncharacterized protein n=1 Tax=Caerostris extrusa TaxID=172846 RepID=A0AAV4T5T9_CAEEX|nr:hypothetical protein CEXT_649801 [Caerostris extrusa]